MSGRAPDVMGEAGHPQTQRAPREADAAELVFSARQCRRSVQVVSDEAVSGEEDALWEARTAMADGGRKVTGSQVHSPV